MALEIVFATAWTAVMCGRLLQSERKIKKKERKTVVPFVTDHLAFVHLGDVRFYMA